MNELYFLLAIINFLGFTTLPFYYGSQLSRTNPLLWLFVPDCQLSALFLTVMFTLILLNKENKYVNQLAVSSSIKYGLWTLLVLIINYQQYAINLEYWALIISHIILLVQPLFLLKKLKLGIESIPAFTFLLLNDASDYLLGTHPYMPPGFVATAAIMTPLITLGLIGLSSLSKRFFQA
ncbi:DUF1405 domain-containing protein [archaeon]|nr:DUF1405 domain-containing protein [archaeon]